jgi:competence protein ComEC
MKKNKYTALLFLAFCGICFFSEAKNLRIHFIDAGQGDAILIETPQGKSALIDTGNLITGFKVSEYLKKQNINSLDYLIFSHMHPDHIGGAFFILQTIKVNKIYDNGEDLTEIAKNSDLHRWYVELARNNDAYAILKAGDKFLLDGVEFRVLWPPLPSGFSNFNTNSLVIMIEYAKVRCLLSGDLTTEAQKQLIKKEGNIKADILKVPHHGADEALCEEFLKKVSAHIAVISVDKDNVKGYPCATTFKKLRNSAIIIYRTDIDKDIVIEVAENGEISLVPDKKIGGIINKN